MEMFHGNEIRRVSKVWRDVHKQPWLLVAEFAEIEGRIQCVGMELRSYLRHRETLRYGDGGIPGADVQETIDAYWTGGRVSENRGSDADRERELAALGIAWHELARHDLLAVEARATEELALRTPHTLRTGTLRDLPFGREIDELRDELAGRIGHLSEQLVALHLEVEKAAGNDAAVTGLEEWQQDLAELRTSVAARNKPGRPRKYDRAYLERVAQIYTEAFRRGSSSPTNEVMRQLGLTSRSVAGKLVMRCRDPEIGLLEPTEKRKPGGVRTSGAPVDSADAASMDDDRATS